MIVTYLCRVRFRFSSFILKNQQYKLMPKGVEEFSHLNHGQLMVSVYLPGTIFTGIPSESLMKACDGILHKLVHIPTQLVCSRNLQN